MEKLNIHLKLVELRSSLESFTKDSKSYDYDYVSGNQILEAIKDKMNSLKILLIPSINNIESPIVDEYITTKDYNGRVTQKQHRDWIINGSMTYTFIDAENPSDTITIPWFLTGSQNDPSKSFGSALTYSERYFLLKFLGIPTDELDPDNKDNSKPSSSQNSSNNTYKFGNPKDEKLKWINDEQVKEMEKYIDSGKSDIVIPRLAEYRWSKLNKDKIIKKLG